MTENRTALYTSEEALAIIISRTKKYQRQYHLDLIEAFRQTVCSCWKYSRAWYEEAWKKDNEKYYSFEEYKSFFYNYIVGVYRKLPDAIVFYITSWSEGSGYSRIIDKEALAEIKIQLKALADEEINRRKQFDRMREETKELRRILKHQKYHREADELVALYMIFTEEKKETFKMFIDIFNYGYIKGKRAVRHKKQTNI